MEAHKRPATRDSEQIIRQSQLERAIELCTLMGIKPSLREVLRLSQILVNFQYNWELNHYDIIRFEQHFNQKTNESLISTMPSTRIDNVEPEKKQKGSSPYQLQVSKELKGKI